MYARMANLSCYTKRNMMHMLQETIWYQSKKVRCKGRQGTRLNEGSQGNTRAKNKLQRSQLSIMKKILIGRSQWLPKVKPNHQSHIPIEISWDPPKPKTPSKRKARERRSSKKSSKTKPKGRKPNTKQECNPKTRQAQKPNENSKHATLCIWQYQLR